MVTQAILRSRTAVAVTAAAVLLLSLAVLPMAGNAYIVILVGSVLMYVSLCVSWNAFCGPARYISLATAAFFGIGVYTAGIFSTLPLFEVMLIGGALSFVLGLVVGITTLRLRGMYFAIFTFGLSELIRQTMVWYEVNMTHTVGRWLPLLSHVTIYYYMLGVCTIVIAGAYLLRRSRWGMALRSIGESEEAAAHIGIHVKRVKIIVFACTCFFMGLSGAVYANRWSYIDPDLAFNPSLTFFVVMMVLVGGIRSTIWGPALGAAVLTVLADVVLGQYPRLAMLLFGAVLILVVVFLPHGLVSLVSRIRRPRVLIDTVEAEESEELSGVRV